MYIPKGFHWVGPVSTVMLGFFIRHNFGAHWDVFVFVQLPLSVIAAEWGAYIWQAGTAYQNYVTRGGQAPEPTHGQILDWNTGKPVEDPAPDGLKPLIRVDGKPMVASYNQVVIAPKFDKVRHVAITLLRQKQQGFKVDLTEKRWVEKRGFIEKEKRVVNNWKFGRDEFLREVIDPWKYYKAIERAGERKNAPYDVVNWRVIVGCHHRLAIYTDKWFQSIGRRIFNRFAGVPVKDLPVRWFRCLPASRDVVLIRCPGLPDVRTPLSGNHREWELHKHKYIPRRAAAAVPGYSGTS